MKAIHSKIVRNIQFNMVYFLANEFKELLEKKHLYQHHNIDMEKYYDRFNEADNISFKDQIGTQVRIIMERNWYPHNFNSNPNPDFHGEYFPIDIPDVKLYCKICKRIEAFNRIKAQDFNIQALKDIPIYKIKSMLIQSFIISYLCQSCKIVPEVFIVRRESTRLIICGRSPIEHIDVPKIIPKKVEKFYSDSILAFQSGQTLSALFQLRTLIEQWCYTYKKATFKSADEAINKYMKDLPEDFKERFYSMKDLYGELSADIHQAKGSTKLFEKAEEKIIQHFKARELFNL